MANTSGICDSFKKEVMQGVHAFGPLTGAAVPVRTAGVADQLKMALYLTTGSLSHATTVYATGSEFTNAGATTGYTAGGANVVVVAGDIINNGGTPQSGCFSPAATVQWTALSSSAAFDTALLYNSSQGGKAIGVFNFGTQSITAGTLTLTMPANTQGNALVELA